MSNLTFPDIKTTKTCKGSQSTTDTVRTYLQEKLFIYAASNEIVISGS